MKVWLTVEEMRDPGKNCWADWRQRICNTFYLHPHIGAGFLWVEQRQNGGTEVFLNFFIFERVKWKIRRLKVRGSWQERD